MLHMPIRKLFTNKKKTMQDQPDKIILEKCRVFRSILEATLQASLERKPLCPWFRALQIINQLFIFPISTNHFT